MLPEAPGRPPEPTESCRSGRRRGKQSRETNESGFLKAEGRQDASLEDGGKGRW